MIPIMIDMFIIYYYLNSYSYSNTDINYHVHVQDAMHHICYMHGGVLQRKP